MARYFIEVAYKGTRYSGFQVQENAITIQSEIEAAFQTIHRKKIGFTGSSRTDAGVHAMQNFFHFDFDEAIHPDAVYKLNSLLSKDIAVKSINLVGPQAHSRFDAISREYSYCLHQFKNPFLNDTSLYYPYRLDLEKLKEAAELIASKTDFSAFCKTNTQVKNFDCSILKSEWRDEGGRFTYTIAANRFLRGMVRLITATQLQVGRGKMRTEELEVLFKTKKKCGISVPAHGLILNQVRFADRNSNSF